MKYIISESNLKTYFGWFLKNQNIEESYEFTGKGYDPNTGLYVRGTVYLYKENNIFGYRHGYDFFYDYDARFKTLKYSGHYPAIEKLDFLSHFPSDVVIDYFSDNLKKKLDGMIEEGIIRF